jgi:hypothetical protein
VPEAVGSLHHLALNVSQASFWQIAERLDARGVSHTGPVDRGFMDSIYFRDPLGLRIELASYRFFPPEGCREADVMIEAHRIRVARGDHHIDKVAPGRRDRALTERGTSRCRRIAAPRKPTRRLPCGSSTMRGSAPWRVLLPDRVAA